MSVRDSAPLDALTTAEALAERGLEGCLGRVPIVLEIGFGRGELLLDLAEARPGEAFLGVEISKKRTVKAARRAAWRGLANVKFVNAPAEYLLGEVLPPGSVAECWINFSDPWPKKRHHKRRLFQSSFVAKLARVLAPGAALHAATDDAAYAQWIHEVLASAPKLENLAAPAPWRDDPPDRRTTAYEAEWLAEGRRIAYFEYRRKT